MHHTFGVTMYHVVSGFDGSKWPPTHSGQAERVASPPGRAVESTARVTTVATN